MRQPVQVSQFIIVPPAGRSRELVRCKELFASYLMRRFPRYSFDVAAVAVLEDDDHFVVIPIMNYVTPDGDSYMCQEPSRSVMAEISEACAGFSPEERKRMVA